MPQLLTPPIAQSELEHQIRAQAEAIAPDHEIATYTYHWTVFHRLNAAEAPYEMEFASSYPSIAAGALWEFKRKYPKLEVIRTDAMQQIGEYSPF
jgi:hypothetical protein